MGRPALTISIVTLILPLTLYLQLYLSISLVFFVFFLYPPLPPCNLTKSQYSPPRSHLGRYLHFATRLFLAQSLHLLVQGG